MERHAMDADRRRARDSRAVLAVLLGLAMAANLVLAHGLANRGRVTVLVPASGGPAWEVGESWAGRRYLEDAARTAAATLLTLTPESAGHAAEAAARMSHASARGTIGAWVTAEAARMARRDLSTAFYPRKIEIARDGLAAVVSGVPGGGAAGADRHRRLCGGAQPAGVDRLVVPGEVGLNVGRRPDGGGPAAQRNGRVSAGCRRPDRRRRHAGI